MKKLEKKASDVGVIVGRFQIDQLHKGHIDLIKWVSFIHPKVIVFLGVSPCMVTAHNPLDFESRKQMILSRFPDINVLYIKDRFDDEVWSKDLDEKITDVITPKQTVTLYGGRDSFIKYYTGKFPTQELLQEEYISASEIRNSLRQTVKNTPEFRAGVIWAAHNQYPRTIPTVDVAILNGEKTKLLLVRKPHEKQYRFVGGFADPNSECYEHDARREVMEETDLEVSAVDYIGSFKINDWRYKNGPDKIKTVFFMATYLFGKPKANDDVCEVKWFDINNFDINNLVQIHREMFQALLNEIEKFHSIEENT